MNQILWTDEAKDTYAAILNAVMENYPLDVSIKMDEKVERLLGLLKYNLKLCPPSAKIPAVRCCTISKFLSVAYRILEHNIILLAFVDNRMEHPF